MLSRRPPPLLTFGGQSLCPLLEADFLVPEDNSSFRGNYLIHIYIYIILSSRTLPLDEILHRNPFYKSGKCETTAVVEMEV